MPLLLAVNDLNQTVAFYRHHLEQQVVRCSEENPDAGAELWQDQTLLVRFIPRSQLTERHPVLMQPLQRHPAGLGLLLQLQAKDLPQLGRRLEKDGYRLLYEREDQQRGEMELWLHDPDGYLVSLQGPL